MSRKAKKSSSVKKFIIIGIAAALAASTLAIVAPPSIPKDIEPSTAQDEAELAKQEERKAFFCGSGIANSNAYIREFVIPSECAEPVAITVDKNGVVWFAESAVRKIGSFDPATEKFAEYELPAEPIFSWDEIPGNDNVRLFEFLTKRFQLLWVQIADVEKIDNGKTIRISTARNYLSITLDDERTKASLVTDDGRSYKFVVKKDNDKLNVYPSSDEREGPAPVASIWSMKFDEQDNLWFPDVTTNAIWRFDKNTQNFETYKVPTTTDFGTSYPINFDFDNNGKIWFSEIYGKNIGVLDPMLAKHNTNNGIEEISARVDLETLGPLAMDGDGNIWFTALTYPATGRLMKLEPEKKSFTTYSMPAGISSPVGVVPDNVGNLWINDHGTSVFLKFNPDTNATSTYVTSLPLRETSIGLYEKCLTQPNGSSITCPGYPVSLPYWNAVDSKGRIWFNEHQGNSLAVFDPDTETLIEYFVPSQNPNWGDCEGYTEPCGLANPLQFTLAPDGKVWFTEWSESKIGVLDPNLPLPISLEVTNRAESIAGDERARVVAHGSTLPLIVSVTADQKLDASVQMRISGTIVPTGRLFNMTAEFSERELIFSEPSTKTVDLKLTPKEGLTPGKYKLTISATYNEVTYSKIEELIVQ
jgi:virginiamycin B lyase